MSDHTITCPSCGNTIPLSRALRGEIERSVRHEFEEALAARERELTAAFEGRLAHDLGRAEREAKLRVEARVSQELADLRARIVDQDQRLQESQAQELALRKRERALERAAQEVELSVARKLDEERARLVAEAQHRLAEEHRLKEAEKDRQLADLRRQIDELRRKAEQGSQQMQGEAGEVALEALLRSAFPWDDITPVSQGVRGADIHQAVVDLRGAHCGGILWECKNAKTWSDAWIVKLKSDQRTIRADVGILVTASLPKGCSRFALVEGVLVTDFSCAAALAAIVRSHLLQVAQARSAVVHKEARLELLHRYLSGLEFRQRVEAVVEAFARMREDLDQERRAAERQWARRARQIETVTLNVAGMYGDLQGLLPSLPPIPQLELPGRAEAADDDCGHTAPFRVSA